MFTGLKFWVAQRLPMRSHFKSLIQEHNGTVVPLEKNADFLISDHLRSREAPAGALSYEFIEACLAAGRLLEGEEREDHRCGPMVGSVRDVADAGRATKVGTREAYTKEDDEVIRAWVRNAVKNGDRLGGNEVWKDLEKMNSRHPWQSWRDRWVKRLRDKMPAGWDNDAIGAEEDIEIVEEEEKSGLPGRQRVLRSSIPPADSESLASEGPEETKLFVENIDSLAQRIQPRTTALEEQRGSTVIHTKRTELSPEPQEASDSRDDLDKKIPADQGEEQPATLPQTTQQQQPEFSEPPSSPSRRNKVASRQATKRPLTTEEFNEIYENIDYIMNANHTDFKSGWEHTAEGRDHTALELEEFFKAEILPFHQKFGVPKRKHAAIVACLKEFAEHNPDNPWKRWRLHFQGGSCKTYNETLETIKENSQDESTVISGDIAPHTPSRKRTLDDVEESPQFNSHRVAETANIKRQRVDKISQSTATQSSGLSQHETSQTAGAKSALTVETIDLTKLSDGRTSSDDYDEEEDDLPPVPTIYPSTQIILEAETQAIDLDVPEPEDGLDSIADSIESDDYQREQMDALRDQELINQQLWADSEVIEPPDKEDLDEVVEVEEDVDVELDLDLEIPEPDDEFEPTDQTSGSTKMNQERLKDPPIIYDQYNDDEDDDETASQASLDFNALANTLLAAGHTPENIITAIDTTSANLSILDTVLDALRKGKGVPRNMRGVWTEKDDEDVQGGDARNIKKVEEKHGWQGAGGCRRRMEFLRESYTAAQLAENE